VQGTDLKAEAWLEKQLKRIEKEKKVELVTLK